MYIYIYIYIYIYMYIYEWVICSNLVFPQYMNGISTTLMN